MAWDTRHLKMAQDIKWSNHGYLLVQRRTGVEEHLSETHGLSANSSMDQVHCQGVLLGPSVGVVPIALAVQPFPQLQVWYLQWPMSVPPVHCFWFYASRLKETLLQTLKHSVWVTLTRIMYIVLSPIHQFQVDSYGHDVCIPRSFDRN